MELARGSFQDENSVPSCKKYHSLAQASKNLYNPKGIIYVYDTLEESRNPKGIIFITLILRDLW